jgi:ribosomal protein L11 methyltransferase
MPWLQLILEAHPDDAEQLSDALSELGASAVTLQDGADQPLYEPPPGETPLWSDTRVIGLFAADTDMADITRQLAQVTGLDPLPPWRVSPLEDKDWEREWMDRFQPMCFGAKLWICPSWHTPPHPEAINILLDPGLAFGTGTHPTTALCLQWLDAHSDLIRQTPVIDYGCGSGILAVAAALLGAEHVWAVDNDPQALIATRDNAEKNHVSDKISVMSPEALPQMQAGVLLANILAQPLLSLADRFRDHLLPGGHIVLSGILDHQAAMVSERYATDFLLEDPATQEDWVRISGTRRAN